MSLLQRLQAAQQQAKEGPEDDGAKAGDLAAKPVPGPTAGVLQTGVRRTSTMGLTGPKTASIPSTSSQPSVAGPSLFGLLASKRLAKRFASRFQSRRLGSSSRFSAAVSVQKEPTYRMEPHRRFRAQQVEEMLRSLLEEKLGKFRYSTKICPNMCKILGDDIKAKVKLMNFDRYKIVSNVVIGQKKDQAVVTCSRCAWDPKLDSYASYTFQNEHIFCTATVFGVYME